MGMSTLVVIGILFLAWMFIKRVLPKLTARQEGNSAHKEVGENAIAKVPEQIQFTRAAAPHWKDEATMQKQATPLLRAGFSDLGIYNVDKMPGVLIRILFQTRTRVSAQICEHPRTGGWIELATRYTDGGSDFLTTLPDQGIAPPPFVRTSRAEKITPAEHLYQQHLTQRKSGGIKPIAASEVIQEMENAYVRYMVWKHNKGLRLEELAQVTAKWAKAKQQAAGQS